MSVCATQEVGGQTPKSPGTNSPDTRGNNQRLSLAASYLSMKSDNSVCSSPNPSAAPEPDGDQVRSRRQKPSPSCLSVNSDCSRDVPPEFSKEPKHSGTQVRSRGQKPSPSCLSVNSDCSRDVPPEFSKEPKHPGTQVRSRRQKPSPSCLSVNSDCSRDVPPEFSNEPKHSGTQVRSRKQKPSLSCLSVNSDCSRDVPPEFSKEPKHPGTQKRTCAVPGPDWSRCAVCTEVQVQDPVSFSCGHRFCQRCSDAWWDQADPSGDQACPRCGKRSRNTPGPDTLPHTITEHPDSSYEELLDHRTNLKARFERVMEGGVEEGKVPLNQIYTALYITEGQSEGVNRQHEVWQLETMSKMNTFSGTAVNCRDIFKPLPNHQIDVRTVLTQGIAGIGKTFSVQKFTLDWAERSANQDMDLLILLSFRELNLLKDKEYSLLALMQVFHPTLKMITAEKLVSWKLVFIFDGLDESRLPLDFQCNDRMFDVTQTASVDVLLTNLIQGNLLPSALIWITTRPAAAYQIPCEYVDRLTEVRGFTDPQKEEYFEKRFRDKDLAKRVITHIKSSRTLYIMCHIPVFCWITAAVLEYMMRLNGMRDMPKGLTEMYAYFLVIQTRRKKQKYREREGANEQQFTRTDKAVLLKLGKLAFEHLEKDLIFYLEDLKKSGLNNREALVNSGVCTEIFRSESAHSHTNVYCFVHLSIQEFLAAVYMFHCYTTKNRGGLKHLYGEEFDTDTSLDDFLRTALLKALDCKKGHLDLFVRFLYGLSLESNQRLLRGLLVPSQNSTGSIPRATTTLKTMIAYYAFPDRVINMFHCLMEMNDNSVHQEIQEYLKSEDKSDRKLSEINCSALAFMLQMSEEVLDVLDLEEYKTSDDGRKRLVPAVRNCRKARLAGCMVTEVCCETVASALGSNPSHMRELDLSSNRLKDSGVKLLSVGLESPHCRLETLRLVSCGLTEGCCEILASALSSNPSHMRELDLSSNQLKDSGVKLLSVGLESPHCRLKTLRLASCGLTEKSCEIIASALGADPCPLGELDLSRNDLKDSGIKLLTAGLGRSPCRLNTLRLSFCLVTEDGCAALASALSSNPSHLRELDLGFNHPGALGEKLLSAGLEDPQWGLETLRLEHGGEHWIKPQTLRRHACRLTMDPDTVIRLLTLSQDNRKATWEEKRTYPDHPARFDCQNQVLCSEALSGCCYWEVEWTGWVSVAATYAGIVRKGRGGDCWLGRNGKSWSLCCHGDRYSAWHDGKETVIPAEPGDGNRIGVYLNWPAGTLSYFCVSSSSPRRLHTFCCRFTEPLYPGFGVEGERSSVCLVTLF